VVLHHVATVAEWEARSDAGYAPAGLAADGYVHCAADGQLAGVLDRYYRGRDDLVLVTIDPAGLTADVVWEDTTGRGERFPHVYGPIPPAAVVAVEPLAVDAAGHRSGI
jgi:uncharacterized protein (DUF952 family)